MAFTTVGSLVTQVRALLQDDAGDRWNDTKVYQSLCMGLIEARRLRPDLFRATNAPPQYLPADAAATIDFELLFRPALILYTAGMVQLQDLEGTQDTRAAALLATFTAKLTTGNA